MASNYFYVHNGLTVGPLTADATSGDLTTTGTITASNLYAGIWPVSTGTSAAASVTISDNVPGSPTSGSLWWDSQYAVLRIYYNDGDSSQWVDINSDVGVTSISAGTDTAVSSITGDVTVYSTSNLQSITNRGATTDNLISITNTTDSVDTTTGALLVAGGIGVGGGGYFGGTVTATSFVGNLTGTASTATTRGPAIPRRIRSVSTARI